MNLVDMDGDGDLDVKRPLRTKKEMVLGLYGMKTRYGEYFHLLVRR